jgi:hypothetical protein
MRGFSALRTEIIRFNGGFVKPWLRGAPHAAQVN